MFEHHVAVWAERCFVALLLLRFLVFPKLDSAKKVDNLSSLRHSVFHAGGGIGPPFREQF